MNPKNLTQSISVLKNVGPKKVKALHSLGIYNIYDLLTYFPFRYNDYRPNNLDSISDGDVITVVGRVKYQPSTRYLRGRLSLTRLKIENKAYSRPLNISVFNEPWLGKKLQIGQELAVYGKYSKTYHNVSAQRIIFAEQLKKLNSMGAIYKSNHLIDKRTIRKLIIEAYRKYAPDLVDYVPRWIKDQYKLESDPQAIHDLHFPSDYRQEGLARRTEKFDTFFVYQMHLQMLKQAQTKSAGVRIQFKKRPLRKFVSSLPYQLTPAQQKVTREILLDMASRTRMVRLLQGDVGSGKTIVAALAVYAAVTSGYQTALMAPTEILARQHAINLSKTFKGFGVRIALLTGETKPKAKKLLLNELRLGHIDLLIGTNALIQPDVKFKKLGLTIVDEQHRFGVNQREALAAKGAGVNSLAMTATPIPRTLAITSYGQMDISIIDQLPKGRKPIKTSWIRPKKVPKTLWFFNHILDLGQQVYVVAPLVQDSGNDKTKALADVKGLYKYFNQKFGKRYRVGLLYGSMDDSQKNQVMNDFKRRKIQILVSTTVIEVGIDDPNATLMMIYNADHFGLAQLHQLRGRIGRGKAQGYCLLVASPRTKTGAKRMEVMESTNNGFIISQADLDLRGPGNVFGANQSGIPKFKVGDPVDDRVILSCAQEDAIRVVNQKNWRKHKDNQGLVKLIHFGLDKVTVDNK